MNFFELVGALYLPLPVANVAGYGVQRTVAVDLAITGTLVAFGRASRSFELRAILVVDMFVLFLHARA